MPFPYKTVLITGATSGIGQALAERLIANGIFVIAVGRRLDRLSALVDKFGSDKVAAEAYDVTDLAKLGEWSEKITTAYPTLDCIILNAGIQRSIDFANPQEIDLATVDAEIITNYTSPLHTIIHFLPHLQSQPQASIILISSGLALVPFPRCANYCATKSALHSLAWTLRYKLANAPNTSHIRVIEVLPPAVQTELHSQQPDLVAAGQGNFGMPLTEFLEETWTALGTEEDEIAVGAIKGRFATVETERKSAFDNMLKALKAQGVKL